MQRLVVLPHFVPILAYKGPPSELFCLCGSSEHLRCHCDAALLWRASAELCQLCPFQENLWKDAKSGLDDEACRKTAKWHWMRMRSWAQGRTRDKSGASCILSALSRNAGQEEAAVLQTLGQESAFCADFINRRWIRPPRFPAIRMAGTATRNQCSCSSVSLERTAPRAIDGKSSCFTIRSEN